MPVLRPFLSAWLMRRLFRLARTPQGRRLLLGRRAALAYKKANRRREIVARRG